MSDSPKKQALMQVIHSSLAPICHSIYLQVYFKKNENKIKKHSKHKYIKKENI